MTTTATVKGKTIYLVKLGGCSTCLGNTGSGIACGELPKCGGGRDPIDDCWVDEEGFAKWVAEERMK